MSAILDGPSQGVALRLLPPLPTEPTELALLRLLQSDSSPSMATMREATGRTERAVRYALTRLKAKGWVITTERGGGYGRRSVHRTLLAAPNYSAINNELQCNDFTEDTVQRSTSEPRVRALPGFDLGLKDLKNQDQDQRLFNAHGVAQFDLFWTAYPRKVGKPRALSAWKKLTHSERESAIAAVPLSGRLVKRDREYQPYPASWLNDRAWEDEDLAACPVTPDPQLIERANRMEEEATERGVTVEDLIREAETRFNARQKR